ncbi:MAG TPA: hypothetical protein VKT28_16295, partial [Puia sp.]|nr:hypothetical protein [Puia sp.]
VSTSPWQLGEYVAYDLKKVFALRSMKENKEICDSSLNIAADTFLQTNDFRNFLSYRNFKQRIADGDEINTDSLIATNPTFFHTYVLVGDYWFKRNEFSKAKKQYETALTKVIATKKEENYIKAQIKKCDKNSVDN